MLRIGDTAPDFSLPNQSGEMVTLEDLISQSSAVVYFYPADFTFVCPTELGDLADHYDQLKSMGVEIYAVSTDTHFTHKAWHDTSETIGKVQYPMLADPTGKRWYDLIQAGGQSGVEAAVEIGSA